MVIYSRKTWYFISLSSDSFYLFFYFFCCSVCNSVFLRRITVSTCKIKCASVVFDLFTKTARGTSSLGEAHQGFLLVSEKYCFQVCHGWRFVWEKNWPVCLLCLFFCWMCLEIKRFFP
jgi:hypothetical protein